MFVLPLALGSVSNLEQELSKALAVPQAEALEAVRRAAVKNVDETGWKMGFKKAWPWGLASFRHAGSPGAFTAATGGGPIR